MSLLTITDGLAFPEGPVVLANGDIAVVEVMGGRLTRIQPDGAKFIIADTGGGPNGAAIGPDGRCYICNNGGMGPSASKDFLLPTEAPHDTPPGAIQAVDMTTGAVETLYAHTPETPFWGPNDLVFDRHGGFWFTDYGRDRGRARMRSSVYYAHATGGAITEAVFPLDGANGIGLSPDGETLYVAETYSAHLWSFRLKAPGIIDRTGGDFPHGGRVIGRGGAGRYLDSLAVDAEGNICCASPGVGEILIFPPQGGTPRAIHTGDFLTTNIAFGGPGRATAYITLGSSGRLASLPWHCPGLALAYG